MVIYEIKNNLNGDTYIGKTHSLSKRWYQHKWNASHGVETHLYRAMRHYGPLNFSINVIKSQVVDGDLEEKALIEERQPAYNMTQGGDGGDTSSSPKFKSAMKKYHSNKPKEEYATYGMQGKKQSEDWRRAINAANSKSTTIDGVLYPSRKAACEALGVTRKWLDYHHPSSNVESGSRAI